MSNHYGVKSNFQRAPILELSTTASGLRYNQIKNSLYQGPLI